MVGPETQAVYSTHATVVVEVVVSVDVVDVVEVITAKANRPARCSPAHHSICHCHSKTFAFTVTSCHGCIL